MILSLGLSLLTLQPAQPARAWEVTANRTLLWQGVAYQPVGLRIDRTPAAIESAAAAGIKDVIVDLPANGVGWDEAFKSLETAGMRYIISVASAAPSALGVDVAPENYRIGGITAARTVDAPMPGGQSVLAVLASQRDGAVVWSKRVPVVNGRVSLEVDPKSELEHVLLLYPIKSDLRLPDFWEGFDKFRDTLLSSLSKNPPGKGCRGILNPLGVLPSFPSDSVRFAPTSQLFRLELEAFLRKKYTTVKLAERTWSVSAPDAETFAELARYVPLWSDVRGVQELWDPVSDKRMVADGKRSMAWQDIGEVVRSAADRRYSRLLDSIHKIADLPVIQDWNGWNGPYTKGERGLDGIGMSVSGRSAAELMADASRPAASGIRASKSYWLIATAIEAANGADSVAAAAQDLSALGARGWYFRTDDPEIRKAVAQLSSQLSTDSSLAQWKPAGLFFPEAALNPAAPMRLPGGTWWLPSPADGNRLDLGEGYAGYRIREGVSQAVAIWSTASERRVKLRLLDPKAVTVYSPTGFDAKPKLAKNGLELTIPTFPLMLNGCSEIPVPEDALATTLERIQTIFKLAEATNAEPGDEQMYYRDAVSAFERNPGGSYVSLRAQLERLSLSATPYVWIEGEASRKHNFSQAVEAVGASGGRVLELRTDLPPPDEGFAATYEFSPRRTSEHEVWLAAKIPPAQMKQVSIVIGDQTLPVEAGPYSNYSTGYGWYKLRSISLTPGSISMTLKIAASEYANLRIDGILVSPEPFRPDGLRLPELALPKPPR